MVKELWWSDAFLQSYLNVKFMKNVYVSICQQFLRAWSCNNSVRKYEITMVLWQKLIIIQHTISLCDLIFNSDSSIFTWYKPNGSHGLETIMASNLMVFISKAIRNWHVHHRFSHCKCNVASFKCKNNFLTKGCSSSSKKVFGFHTIMMKTAWKRQNRIGNFPAKNSEISEPSPWPWVSPADLNIINSSLQSISVIKWTTMTKGTWNYDTLISSYCVSHSVTTE